MSIADDIQNMIDARADDIDARTEPETPQERRARLADEFAAAIEGRFTQFATPTNTTEADSLDHITQELY